MDAQQRDELQEAFYKVKEVKKALDEWAVPIEDVGHPLRKMWDEGVEDLIDVMNDIFGEKPTAVSPEKTYDRAMRGIY